MKSFFAKCLILVASLGAAQALLLSHSARAMGQDTRSVIRGGTYGLIGGTVVGLAVLPLTGSVRGVFIGSSLGLYMGIIMGVYHATHRNEPDYPLRGESSSDAERESSPRLLARAGANDARTPMTQPLSARIALSVPVFRF